MHNTRSLYRFLRMVILTVTGLCIIANVVLAKVAKANPLMRALAIKEASVNQKAGVMRKRTQNQISAFKRKAQGQLTVISKKFKGRAAKEKARKIRLALLQKIKILQAVTNTKVAAITRSVQAEKKVILLHKRAATSFEIKAASALIENAVSINSETLKAAITLIQKGQKVTANQLEEEARLYAIESSSVSKIEEHQLEPIQVVAPVFFPPVTVLTYRQKVEALLDCMLFERPSLRPVALPANRDDLNRIREIALLLVDRHGAQVNLRDGQAIPLRVGVVQPFLSKAYKVFLMQRTHGIGIDEALVRVSFSEKLDAVTGDKDGLTLSTAQKNRLYLALKTAIEIMGMPGITLKKAQDFVVNMLEKTLPLDNPEGFFTLLENPDCDFAPFVARIMPMVLGAHAAANPQQFLDDVVKGWINEGARQRQQVLRGFRALKTTVIQNLNRDLLRAVEGELAYRNLNANINGDILNQPRVTMREAHDAARLKFAQLRGGGHLAGLDYEMFYNNPFLADIKTAEPRLAVIRAAIPGVANANNGTEAVFLAALDAFKVAILHAVPAEDRIDNAAFNATFDVIRANPPNRANLLARLKRLEEFVRGRSNPAQAAKVVYDFAMKNQGRCPDGIAQGLASEETIHVYALPQQYADNLDIQAGIAFAKSLTEYFEQKIENSVQEMFTIDAINAALVPAGTAHIKLNGVWATANAGGNFAIADAVQRVLARPAGIIPINSIPGSPNVLTRSAILEEARTYAKIYLHNALCYTLPLQGGHQPLVYIFNVKVDPSDFMDKLFRGGQFHGYYLAPIQDNNGMEVVSVRINGSYNFQRFTLQSYMDVVQQNIRLPHEGDDPGPKSAFSEELLTHMIHSDPIMRRKYEDMQENGENDFFAYDTFRQSFKAPAIERLVRRFSIAADKLDDIRLP